MNRKVHQKGAFLDNQYVVPYNRDLLVRFQCHINLEICNSSRSLKYLFKYCLKGHDTATMLLTKRNKGQSSVSKKIIHNVLMKYKVILMVGTFVPLKLLGGFLDLIFIIVSHLLNVYLYIWKIIKW